MECKTISSYFLNLYRSSIQGPDDYRCRICDSVFAPYSQMIDATVIFIDRSVHAIAYCICLIVDGTVRGKELAGNSPLAFALRVP
jgi:hypothetical protein